MISFRFEEQISNSGIYVTRDERRGGTGDSTGENVDIVSVRLMEVEFTWKGKRILRGGKEKEKINELRINRTLI